MKTIVNDSFNKKTKETTTNTNAAATTATKHFGSSSELRSWLDASLTPKLYKVLHVDWTRNSVRVECIPLAAKIGMAAMAGNEEEVL